LPIKGKTNYKKEIRNLILTGYRLKAGMTKKWNWIPAYAGMTNTP